MRIAVDALGGDYAPREVVAGTISAARGLSHDELVLVGKPERSSAEVLGRASKWRGGAQFINFIGQYFDSVADLYATDDEKTLLYAKAPDFSPLTPTELAEIQARQAAAAAAGRGGRGGARATRGQVRWADARRASCDRRCVRPASAW